VGICVAAVLSVVPAGAGGALRVLQGDSREADGIPFVHPSSIRFSPEEDLFYIADTGNRRIVLLRSNLEPAGALSLVPLGLSPYCVLPVGDGSAWVTDLNKSDIFRVTARAEAADTIRLGGAAAPGRMAWGPNRLIYVIDRAKRSVMAIDPAIKGSSPEVLQVPTEGVLEDLFVAGDGEVLVAAATGTAFLLRARGGEWQTWGAHGERRDGYSFPTGVASDGRGGIWVVDAFRHELRRLDENRSMIQSTSEMGTEPGQLLFPVGVATDRDGHPAVLERGGRRVQRFAEVP
jgi:hypothetical protein